MRPSRIRAPNSHHTRLAGLLPTWVIRWAESTGKPRYLRGSGHQAESLRVACLSRFLRSLKLFRFCFTRERSQVRNPAAPIAGSAAGLSALPEPQHDAGMEVKEANREERMPLLSKANPPGIAVLDPPTCHRQSRRSRQTPQLASRPTSEQHLAELGCPKVRLSMSIVDAEALANLLSSNAIASVEQRILDQLWLRTTLIEQSRRTRNVERRAFRERADRVLSALDPESLEAITA